MLQLLFVVSFSVCLFVYSVISVWYMKTKDVKYKDNSHEMLQSRSKDFSKYRQKGAGMIK